MKKALLISAFLILLFFIPSSFWLVQNLQNKNNDTISYKLDDRTYRLLVADSPHEWQRGLMDVRKLQGVDGMIFLFPDKAIRTFWNKNTHLDLEVIWLNDEKIVGKSLLPSIEKSRNIVTVQSPSEVNKVIEIILK
ncbi:DUF192 domain-containing protein [Candidatus Roizmanbacteria bacterium]|nr:DUF192 domain-containing protein [Candidatus Roizmanbacteria bacterium]